MRPKNTTPISELRKERKRLKRVIETFLLETQLGDNPLTKETWCLKAKLDKCYLSAILTDKTVKRRVGEKGAIKLANAVCKREIKVTRADLRPDLFLKLGD